MTDNTQELDGLLNAYLNACAYSQGTAWEQEEEVKEAKQAILDWHNKQVKKLIGNREPSEDNIYDTPEGVSLYLSREHRKAIRNEFRGEILSKLKESK